VYGTGRQHTRTPSALAGLSFAGDTSDQPGGLERVSQRRRDGQLLASPVGVAVVVHLRPVGHLHVTVACHVSPRRTRTSLASVILRARRAAQRIHLRGERARSQLLVSTAPVHSHMSIAVRCGDPPMVRQGSRGRIELEPALVAPPRWGLGLEDRIVGGPCWFSILRTSAGSCASRWTRWSWFSWALWHLVDRHAAHPARRDAIASTADAQGTRSPIALRRSSISDRTPSGGHGFASTARAGSAVSVLRWRR
jgi:hypothetical protein